MKTGVQLGRNARAVGPHPTTAAATKPAEPAAARTGDNLGDLLHELTLPDDASELRHLVELCRHSSRIRAWLFGRFANDAGTQAAFRAVLTGAVGTVAPGAVWSPVLQRQVLSQPGQSGGPPGRYGGLTEAGILTLIKRYQAGGIDETIFLLVRCWLRFRASGGQAVPVALWRPTLQQWAAITSDGSGERARHVARAVRFFHERSGRRIGEADFGYTHSWKIHVLLFILERPQACYRVSELSDHLPVKFRLVDRKAIRKFCRDHGIRRDARAGRPWASKRAIVAKSTGTWEDSR